MVDPEAPEPDSKIPLPEGEIAPGLPVGMPDQSTLLEISVLLFYPLWHLTAVLPREMAMAVALAFCPMLLWNNL